MSRGLHAYGAETHGTFDRNSYFDRTNQITYRLGRVNHAPNLPPFLIGLVLPTTIFAADKSHLCCEAH
jgi:hypothetical protein